jgi:hypothetical protein
MPADFQTRPNTNVVQPGAYSAVSTSELNTPAPNTGPIPAILGQATGGPPGEPLYFTSASTLLAVLRGGAAYDGARFAFTGGAQQVCVVRVGKKVTQGSIELAGATGELVKLTSIGYGTWVNGITVEVTTGPIVTLKYTDALGNVFKESWNFTSLESGSPTNPKIAEAINGKLYGYTASNFVTAEAKAGTGALKTAAAAALAGGEEEAPEAAQWTSALEALETQDISVITPMTAEESVHAEVETHCINMSASNARHERTCIVGGATGESPAGANQAKKTIERIASLHSARVQVACPGTYQLNAKGEQTLYPPFYRAALYAGMHCGLPDVATSLCHREVPEIAPEIAYSTVQGGPLDQLLLAGASPTAPKPGGGSYVVDSLSTSNEASGYFRDFHKTRSADYVARFVRKKLEAKFTGKKTLNGFEEAIEGQAEIALKELLSAQIIRAFNKPTAEPGPTTGAIVTSSNSMQVGLPVVLIDANKFIFLTVALQSPASAPIGA